MRKSWEFQQYPLVSCLICLLQVQILEALAIITNFKNEVSCMIMKTWAFLIASIVPLSSCFARRKKKTRSVAVLLKSRLVCLRSQRPGGCTLRQPPNLNIKIGDVCLQPSVSSSKYNTQRPRQHHSKKEKRPIDRRDECYTRGKHPAPEITITKTSQSRKHPRCYRYPKMEPTQHMEKHIR